MIFFVNMTQDDFRNFFQEHQSKLEWFIPPVLFGTVLLIGAPVRLAFSILFVAGIYVFQQKTRRYGAKNGRTSIYESPDYIIYKSMVVLIAAITKADGKVAAEEIRYIEKKFKKEYLPWEFKRMARSLKEELEKQTSDLDEHLQRIEQDFSVSEKVQLLFLLVGIALTDKLLTANEEQLLQKITNGIGIPYRTLDSILAMHHFRREYDESKRSKSKPTSQSDLETAYKILDVDLTATETEIKKAYKKLAIIHHPDKVAHLGESMQQAAAEKFKIIVGAYDLICKKKGIV